MGLPTIQVVLADNQRGIAEALCCSGVALLADGPDVVEAVRDRVRGVLQEVSMLREMSSKAAALVDGLGTSRVAALLMRGSDAAPPVPG